MATIRPTDVIAVQSGQMNSDPQDEAIVTAVFGLANHLGLRTIAEDVESADQQDFLR